jgi:hypothetical protein
MTFFKCLLHMWCLIFFIWDLSRETGSHVRLIAQWNVIISFRLFTWVHTRFLMGSVVLISLVFCVVFLMGSVVLISLVFCVVFLMGSVVLIFLVFYVVLLCVFTFWVPCCVVRYYFRIKTMFGSSLPPVHCRRAHVLFTLFVFVCV